MALCMKNLTCYGPQKLHSEVKEESVGRTINILMVYFFYLLLNEYMEATIKYYRTELLVP